MKYLYILILVSLLLLAGCSKTVADVKSDKYVGEQVAVSGMVETSIKFGPISGYTLVDKAGDRISVASDELPKEGSRVTARGTLIKDSLLGYYIKT